VSEIGIETDRTGLSILRSP